MVNKHWICVVKPVDWIKNDPNKKYCCLFETNWTRSVPTLIRGFEQSIVEEILAFSRDCGIIIIKVRDFGRSSVTIKELLQFYSGD